MSDPKNPPAFPCEAQGNREVPAEHDYIQTGIYSAKFPGMTLRDWFAGKVVPVALRAGIESGVKFENLSPFAAKAAYDTADAMLAERERRSQ